mmetsp:Transcript_12598/g.21003  ORF Transcript_12598/g.21003 Transcript_12598/m.21003 type:complete len:500 (+) Transcript_12598:218-1717(+)
MSTTRNIMQVTPNIQEEGEGQKNSLKKETGEGKQRTSIVKKEPEAKREAYCKGLAEDGAVINGSLRPVHRGELLIGVEGKWYDATKFGKYHPGGDIIYEFENKDATAQFLAYHDPNILKKLKLKIKGEYDVPGGNDFHMAWLRLNAKFEKEGRYKTPIGFLYSRVAILIALFAGVVGMIYMYRATGQAVLFGLGAACLAAIWQQSGFLMHDTMHNHILHNRREDQRLGFIFGNVLVGIAGQWWRDEHNEHHVFTNTVVDGVGPSDPQMVEDVWIQSELLIPYFFQPSVTIILQCQQYYFVPLCIIAGLLFVKIDSLTHTSRSIDIIGAVLHIGWVGAVLLYLPTLSDKIFFYFLANLFSGILSIQLLVSHYAKPWTEKEATKTPGSFAARQVEAVLDITCPPWLDWFHGGLHIHSVHHMFPRMCRCHYREVYDEIIGMCEDHNVELDRCGWIEAIQRCVHHFGTVKGKLAAKIATKSSVDLASQGLRRRQAAGNRITIQ